jgi:hypothetical protein
MLVSMIIVFILALPSMVYSMIVMLTSVSADGMAYAGSSTSLSLVLYSSWIYWVVLIPSLIASAWLQMVMAYANAGIYSQIVSGSSAKALSSSTAAPVRRFAAKPKKKK